MKFEIGQIFCKKAGVELDRLAVEIDEIQSNDSVYVIHKKAEAMFNLVKKPLVVSDDAWSIPALSGFPGAYMKDINDWLRPEDWITLMSKHNDKRIFLEQRLAYIDETGVTVFEGKVEGKFLSTISKSDGLSIHRIISLGGGDGRPYNELRSENAKDAITTIEGLDAWPFLIDWYKEKYDQE